MAEKAPYSAMVERYERLKKQYFSSAGRKKYDDEGEEMPNAVDRGLIVQQFEQMGVEIPMTPDQPITFVDKKPE